MAGEIHGIISREDAWRMWAPYGERMINDTDGKLDPENMNAAEAVAIISGADSETIGDAYGFWYDENDTREWTAGLRDLVASGNIPYELRSMLAQTNAAQLAVAKAKRAWWFEKHNADYVRQLSQGALILSKSGILSSEQAEIIQNRTLGPDGTPAVQYTPMTSLEIYRLYKKYEGGEHTVDRAFSTDLRLGAIHEAISLRKNLDSYYETIALHESVHANFSGLEIHDVTRVDGWRYPYAAVFGLCANQPTIDIDESDDYSDMENMELNEGWTHYLTQVLFATIPECTNLYNDPEDMYDKWARLVAKIRNDYPALFQTINNVAFMDATPESPQEKEIY